ncbi:putative premnaspirodiene oxygenase [Lupinus albus]|uniref:Putative premnaspirodiene oxygenase n=1 Tax=Lupinus albus TaxID=3870 RepID=A0A6A4PRS9_LUPAL|nr:putative premnaspirodiene oxygenase [Lupinus albus]
MVQYLLKIYKYLCQGRVENRNITLKLKCFTCTMELQLCSPVTIVFLLLTLLLAKIYKQKIKGKNSMSHKLPPGPWKLPLIGNLHQLVGAESLPHHTLRNLSHKYGPLMHLQLGEISTLVVSSPDMAKEIMKTHDIAFADRPQFPASQALFYGATNIAYSPYNDYWRQMRKICNLELLSAKRVQSFSFIREDEVSKLLQSIHLSCQGSLLPLNLTKGVFSLVSTLLSRAVFGDNSEYEDEILSFLKKAIELTGGFDVADFFPSMKPIHFITGLKGKLENLHKKMDKMLQSIVDKQQSKMRLSNEGGNEKEKESLVDVLLRVKQNDSFDIPLTVDNIKAVIWDIFGAGTDTSAATVEWAMAELIKNPKAREKVQAEIREAFKGKETIYERDLSSLSYLKSVIKETMRLHPPAPFLVPRECRQECKIGEYEIPIKTRVIVNAWAIARDPNYWYDADKRMCPGSSLGMAIIELPLAALLYHFDWELPNGMKPEELDMSEDFGSAVAKKNNLYLIPTPYNYSIHDNVN